jgi:hypothetical protein
MAEILGNAGPSTSARLCLFGIEGWLLAFAQDDGMLGENLSSLAIRRPACGGYH